MKFLSKHYIFIVLVALLTLILGLSFSLAPKDADAASTYVHVTCKFRAQWKNPKGETFNGKYKNSQGVEINDEVDAYVYRSYTNATYDVSIGDVPKIKDKINRVTDLNGNEIKDPSSKALAFASSGNEYICEYKSEPTDNFWGVSYRVNSVFIKKVSVSDIFNVGSETISADSDDYGKIGRLEKNRVIPLSHTFNFEPVKMWACIWISYQAVTCGSNKYSDDEFFRLETPIYSYDCFDFLNNSDVKAFEDIIKDYHNKNTSNIGGYSFSWGIHKGDPYDSFDRYNRTSDFNYWFTKYKYYIPISANSYLTSSQQKICNRFSQAYVLEYDSSTKKLKIVRDEQGYCNRLTLFPMYFPNEYTITYNSGTGSGGPTSTTVLFNEAYPALESLPTAPTGWNFNGYWTAADGGTQVYDASGTALLSNYITIGDSTLYAQYTRAAYNLTFNPNGGAFAEGATTTISATYGLEYPAITLSPATVPTGKYFNGYWTKTSGGTQIYDASLKIVKGATYTSTADKTLYAQYLSNKYTVQYFDTGPPDNNTTPTATATATYGLTLNLRTPNAKPGHYFSGWKRVGTENVYDGSIKTPNWGANGTTIKLYAVWTAEKYKFVFDPNGGSSVSDQIYTYGVTYTLPAPTRTGYTFAGWKINGNSIAVSGSYTVNTDFGANGTTVSCVAQWTPIGYTVRFNGNGGATTAGATTVSQGFTFDQAQKLTSNTFVKSGYIFTGWAESVGGSVVYYNNQLVVNLASTKGAIKNLYAVWGETWLNDVEAPSLKDTSQTNSASNPYLITSGKNLAWMALQTQTSSLSGYYQQEGDIDLYGKEWIPIGKSSSSFIGTYDGNGYEIKNIKISAITNVKRENNGLFGYGSSNATLKNIIVSSGEINGNGAYTGGIVGRIEGSGQVKNCVNFATINSSFVTINSSLNSVGGIAGRIGTEAIIENCANYANVTGYNNVGGIVGNAAATSSTISKCYVDLIVTVKGNSGVGGIAGIQYMADRKLYISFSAFLGTIDANSNYGAFIGQADSTSSSVSNCYAKAVIPSRAKYYGLVGNCGANIINNCVFETKLASETSYTKRYRGTSFENWVILQGTNIAVPSGLTWIGTGGEKITDIQQLKDIGYTSV